MKTEPDNSFTAFIAGPKGVLTVLAMAVLIMAAAFIFYACAPKGPNHKEYQGDPEFWKMLGL